MSAKKDWTGQKYFRLTFIKESEEKRTVNGNVLWEALCDCSVIITVQPSRVKVLGTSAGRHIGCIGSS
jgi:hypothetical protein